MSRWNSLDQETVDVGSINSFKGRLDKIRKTRMGFLWILHGPQSPRPHGDWTPVRPHKVSYKVSYVACKAVARSSSDGVAICYDMSGFTDAVMVSYRGTYRRTDGHDVV